MPSKQCPRILRKPGYAFAVALALAGFVFSQTRISGRVVEVSDGDTITVLTAQKKQTKVRLAGIDAPEKGQDYGNAAKQYLSLQIFGETVTLDGNKVDRYGRLVAKVLKGGSDVYLLMVHRGFAWHYKQYESEQSDADREVYAEAERLAREARLGLWIYPDPTPPWEFRNSGEGTASTPAPSVKRTAPKARSSVIAEV